MACQGSRSQQYTKLFWGLKRTMEISSMNNPKMNSSVKKNICQPYTNLSTYQLSNRFFQVFFFFIYPKWLAQSRRSLEIKDAFYYLLQRHRLPYHHMDLINSANLAFDNFESLSGNNKKDAFYRDEKRK